MFKLGLERGSATCRHATPRGGAACASSTASSCHPRTAATAAAAAPSHAPRTIATSAAISATSRSTAWPAASITACLCTRHRWSAQLLAAAPITLSPAALYLVDGAEERGGEETGEGGVAWRRCTERGRIRREGGEGMAVVDGTCGGRRGVGSVLGGGQAACIVLGGRGRVLGVLGRGGGGGGQRAVDKRPA